jgi:hypothetical protein
MAARARNERKKDTGTPKTARRSHARYRKRSSIKKIKETLLYQLHTMYFSTGRE